MKHNYHLVKKENLRENSSKQRMNMKMKSQSLNSKVKRNLQAPRQCKMKEAIGVLRISKALSSLWVIRASVQGAQRITISILKACKTLFCHNNLRNNFLIKFNRLKSCKINMNMNTSIKDLSTLMTSSENSWETLREAFLIKEIKLYQMTSEIWREDL